MPCASSSRGPKPDGERTAAKLRARGCEVLVGAAAARSSCSRPISAAGLGRAWCMTSANAARRRRAASAAGGTVAAAGLHGRPAHRRTPARSVGFADVTSRGRQRAGSRASDRGAATGVRAPLLYLAGEDRAGDLAGDLAAAGIVGADRGGLSRRQGRDPAGASCEPRWRPAGSTACCIFRGAAPRPISTARGRAGILDRALAPVHYCLSHRWRSR